MNASCITCKKVKAIAVLRSGGYAPFFYCGIESRKWTHLMPGDRKPCHEQRGGAVPITPDHEPMIPLVEEAVV